MKEICIDARMLTCSGIGTYIENLLGFLKKTSYRFKVIIRPEHLTLFDYWDVFEPIILDREIYSIAEQIQLPLKIPRCDLFWAPHYNIPLAPIKARKRLTTIHDVNHLAFFTSLSVPQKMYVKMVMYAAIKLSEKVITDSLFSKEELQKYTSIHENAVSVIPLGVNRHLFQKEKKIEDEQFIAKYSLPKKIILFVGNLKPHKNLRNLIEALYLLSQRGIEDLHLIVIGKKEGFKIGEDIGSLLRLHPYLNKNIHFLGSVSNEELSSAYRLAQVFVFPSFYEGFGLPALEAMSSGCPTIASSSASLPEVCGRAAVYVDPHSPQEIAQAIHNVLTDQTLSAKLKKEGFERSQHFSWERCAEQHLELIDQVLRC